MVDANPDFLRYTVSQWLDDCGCVEYCFGSDRVDCAQKLLTPSGLIHAWALGILIWGCLGWQGYTVVMFYF